MKVIHVDKVLTEETLSFHSLCALLIWVSFSVYSAGLMAPCRAMLRSETTSWPLKGRSHMTCKAPMCVMQPTASGRDRAQWRSASQVRLPGVTSETENNLLYLVPFSRHDTYTSKVTANKDCVCLNFFWCVCFLCRKATTADRDRWCHQRHRLITGCWSAHGHYYHSPGAQNKK